MCGVVCVCVCGVCVCVGVCVWCVCVCVVCGVVLCVCVWCDDDDAAFSNVLSFSSDIPHTHDTVTGKSHYGDK